MPFGVAVYGVFIPLRGWRLLLSRPESVFRLAAYLMLEQNTDKEQT